MVADRIDPAEMSILSHKWMAAALALAMFTLARPAAAQVTLNGNDGAQLALGVGAFDVLHQNTAAEFRGEYRFGNKLWLLRPIIGGEVTSDGAAYGYGGFALEIFFGDHWLLMPNEAVGLFERGDGKRLGSAIEFRSGAEVDYRFADKSRLGFSFHHISNAGLTARNPGEEEALIVYSLPLPGLP
jgi:hypothetical protein